MLHDELFYLMRRLVQEHTARWQDAGITVTKPQYVVLRALDEHPGLEQTALAVAAASTKATLTEMLTRLEAVGLVERRPDPTDGRRRFVFLTPAGEAQVADTRALATSVDDTFLTRLTAPERVTLRALLLRLERD